MLDFHSLYAYFRPLCWAQKSLAIRAARKQAKHLVDAMRESINFKSISVTARKVVK